MGVALVVEDVEDAKAKTMMMRIVSRRQLENRLCTLTPLLFLCLANSLICDIRSIMGSCRTFTFLSRLLMGGEADDGPKVNDRDNDEASTEPKPDPPR